MRQGHHCSVPPHAGPTHPLPGMLCAEEKRCHRVNGCGGLARVQTEKRSAEVCLGTDRKSTRLNSSHVRISYAVFCLKKKKIKQRTRFQNHKVYNTFLET